MVYRSTGGVADETDLKFTIPGRTDSTIVTKGY
jgi:hypothetical protein